MTHPAESGQAGAAATEGAVLAAGTRREERAPCRTSGLTILIANTDGSTTSLLMYPRNLSAGGVSFLSGVELSEGVRCAMQFMTEAGRRVIVHGQVRWSTPVIGRLRRVGMAFDRPLDPERLESLLRGGT